MHVSFDHCRLVETGDWTIPDLVKYLISVQPPLQLADVERIRFAPVFPEEATTSHNGNEDDTPKKVPKAKASNLYEPLDVFRSLGLPIIDWRGKDHKHEWRSDSEEGTPNTV